MTDKVQISYFNEFVFKRTDLYSEEPISLSDIRFEQAAILHNLGKTHC